MDDLKEARHNAIINHIMSIHHSNWIDAAKEAAQKERLKFPSEDVVELGKKLETAMRETIKGFQQMEDLLRKGYELDPQDNPEAFKHFHLKRLAQLFLDRPHVVSVLKIRARCTTYNVGYQNLDLIYDKVAANPCKVLHNYETLCQADEGYCRSVTCRGELRTLRDNVRVMEFLFDNYNEPLCKLYWQYRTVPTRADWEMNDKNSKQYRPTRGGRESHVIPKPRLYLP
ncbi:hypothetical protein B0O99DRAFT_685054 [Bisporella sp. PMI_857]|nr:hypothetical protein B0O99DRAFT_685054 [Bisporella sp. PMI_857]